tara:strand:+ start:38 stop:406 length:369 start_codon:yes stop_codon:yes gene_type:complete
MRRKRKPNKYQFLVSKFIRDSDKVWKNVKEIKCQINIAKKLYRFIEDENFWRQLHLPFKLNSLAFFLTKDGKDLLYIEGKKQKLIFAPPKEYALQKEKVCEDKKVKRSIKTISDFLNEESKE